MQIFRLLSGPMKTRQISYVIFQTMDNKVYQSANFKIFECSGEIHQIPHVINETTIHFSVKVYINVQYNSA